MVMVTVMMTVMVIIVYHPNLTCQKHNCKGEKHPHMTDHKEDCDFKEVFCSVATLWPT